MIALIQRVTRAQVTVGDSVAGVIDRGVLALVGVDKADEEADADRLARRILNYRVFEDAQGRMNLSVLDVSGGVLLVPQFTLAADTGKGNRASFATAAPPARAEQLFERLAEQVEQWVPALQRGCFGAHMQVMLINDGPVTFRLTTRR